MPSIEVVRLASKYAAKIGRQHLANKVNEIASNLSKPSYHTSDDVDLYRKKPGSPEKAPVDETAYSQDMFEDSETITKEKENLIRKMQQQQKKKNECVSPKPMRVLKTNPFKKAQDVNARLNASLDDSTVSETRMTFMEWYDDNQSRLQEENPLLKESELAVAAMKQYRQRMQQSTAAANSTNPLDDLSQFSNKIGAEPKKKKSVDSKPENKKSKSSEEESTEPTADGSAAAARKRKADIEDNCESDKPKKKPSSFSKLKAFSFTKSA